jgi:hypothetical protein
MRLPNVAHTSQPWRIHEFVPDFRLEDVWGLAAPVGADGFAQAIESIASSDPAKTSSRAVRMLFGLRWKLGELLGWDQPESGVGARVPTLRDRLPADLLTAPGPTFGVLPFTSLYLLDNEFAAEAANETMHGVMHIGLVRQEAAGYRAQMAVLVKPNGLLGDSYLAAIRPFRHLIVYPPLLSEMERSWRARASSRSRAGR